MKKKLNLAILFTIALVSFPLNFDLPASDLNQSKSKIRSIEEDLEKSRNNVLSSREYSFDKDLTSEEIDVVIRPYKLSAEQSPDWWSEKQAYDMSFLLVKALNNYPGINASLEKTWEERILETENLLINKKESDINKNRVIITPFVEDFKFQVLTPKKRGIGLVVISINRKTCINETFLSTRYVFDSNIDIEDIESKQLLVKKKSGSSLNANLLLVGKGGGKFKAPEKPLKEVVYNSIADSAEGLYCALTNNGECIKYYQNREYQFPTVEKKRKKKKDKSC
ncbi:hypothetical protein EU94_1604 [Prochlorococcus marinus str. MIT 9123]|uniref:Fam-a protein n=1 Tax=Prochlorococcus marinus str. MIT 9116 TaxID=167544 RepID=A0A0A1ZR71_PROMR|nr:hypothetical protein [Prochlorococcus marinus]KGF92067.1 hypothetical protein EU93_0883 [Prochlorococcus marinus str. MIT 9116]KGF93448.1 hypothetical protein EU94_1604 [Prochlorococcus marinus str. MIT 9123]